MSHKATNWAVSQRGISPAAKVLLWQLADRHNPDNGCFPDQKTLERDCEMVRSTVNERLKELERVGLIKRVIRSHPVTKRRMPTRYYLAFEDDFASIVGRDGDDDAPEVEGESQVRNPDMENDASQVRNPDEAMSDLTAEPCPPGRTHNSSLTSKVTSNSTGKRAGRAGRESDFKSIWKMFPMRPGSSELAAWEAFERLDDVDAAKCLKGAERFAIHFREEGVRSAKPIEDRLQYVKFLSNWIAEQGWIAAAALPIKVLPGTDAAKAMEGFETINKFSQRPLFEACERLRGKPAPVGSSGAWSFPVEIVDEARRQVASHSGGGSP